MSRTIPPIDMAAEPHSAASYAADEVSAWLSAPPLSREEMVTAVQWFRRLRVHLGRVVGLDVELHDQMMSAEKMVVIRELRVAKVIGLGEAEYLAACHRAAEWRSYALRLRGVLAGLEHHDCALRGDVGPCDGAVGRALNENNPDGDGRQR